MMSTDGRHGSVEVPEGDFRVSFREQNGATLTPEHLFAGAYAACYYSAIENAAERAHRKIPGLSVIANVALDEDDRGGWQLAVTLRAAMPGIARRDGEHLMHLAHESCPYSKALRARANVTLELD